MLTEPSSISGLDPRPDTILKPIYPANFNCLKGHKISPALRGRMIDWMIEIITKFDCSANTFFLAVHVLDSFFKKSPKGLEPDDLLISGALSIVIASKFEDVEAIGIDVAQKCIVHGKYSIDDMAAMELEMLRIIEFDCLVQHPSCFLGEIFSAVSLPNSVIRSAELILILNRLEYNCYYSPLEESVAALVIACKSLNQFSLSQAVIDFTQISEDIIEITTISIKNQLFAYKLNPPKFKLVFSYLQFSMESAECSKLFRFCDKDLENEQLILINNLR